MLKDSCLFFDEPHSIKLSQDDEGLLLSLLANMQIYA